MGTDCVDCLKCSLIGTPLCESWFRSFSLPLHLSVLSVTVHAVPSKSFSSVPPDGLVTGPVVRRKVFSVFVTWFSAWSLGHRTPLH